MDQLNFVLDDPQAEATEILASSPTEHDTKLAEREALDQLIADSRVYRSSAEYLGLMKFMARVRGYSPFNALLLHIQKPGLTLACSAAEWRQKYRRTIKSGSRPLIILWPFGPVSLVFDVLDTEGEPLPPGVLSFAARGDMTSARIDGFKAVLAANKINVIEVDEGDAHAGSICRKARSTKPEDPDTYELNLNGNHDPNVQFVTLAHELAHLFLGHLGRDHARGIDNRSRLGDDQVELEAESVAYLVSDRQGIESSSHTYLANYVDRHTTVDHVDIYQVARAAGRIEALLGVAANRPFEKFKT